VREACPDPDYGYGHYAECDDDSVRYELIEGGENKYLFVFPRGSDQLSYGYADGYVADLCSIREAGIEVVSTGPAPAMTACRTCKFCPSTWDSSADAAGGAGGAGGGGLPDCVFDASGKISLPAP
jgi:hypothetical protein